MASVGRWLGGGGGGSGNWDKGWGTPYSSDIWDPHGGRSDDTTVMAQANVDWLETHKSHLFRADLPGVRKEEIKVVVEDGNMLQISGERTKEEEQSTDRWRRVERHRGSFNRRFLLPENANVDDIRCTLDHGVLTVEVAKKETPETPRNVRSIDVA